MGHRPTGFVVTHVPLSLTRAVLVTAVLLGLALVAAFIWFLAIAPAVASFVLAALSAAAWCRCLDGSAKGQGHASKTVEKE